MQKFKATGDSRHIYQNELCKACFQHGMTYWDCKDFPKKIAADKVLLDKAFDRYDDINVDLLNLFIYFLTKSLPVVVLKIKRSNQELVKNCTKQSLENLKNGNYTYLL